MRIKGKIKLPSARDLDLTRELLHIGDRYIIGDITGHIQQQEDITGKRYPPLAESTIRQKRKFGGAMSKADTPLIGKERRLFNSFKTFRVKVNSVYVRIDPVRRDVANILQNIGVRSRTYGRRFFHFFGVTKNAELKARRYIAKKISSIIKKYNAK